MGSKWDKYKQSIADDWNKASKKRKAYLVLFGYPVMTIPVLVISLAAIILAMILTGILYVVTGIIEMIRHPLFLSAAVGVIAVVAVLLAIKYL